MTQPELCNFDGRLYTFSNVPAEAAAGIARRSQLNKSCQDRQHGPSVTVQITPTGPLSSTSAGQDDVLGKCSIRSSAFVHVHLLEYMYSY